MKRIFAFLIVLLVMFGVLGCSSLRDNTTFLPEGKDEYMQADIDGREVGVRTLVKVEF